jgi:peptidoglycan hydrolase-like protein with peptidoglycan-binding domain
MDLLKKGVKGEAVAALQKGLGVLGFDAGKADGIFGGQTVKALTQFQKAKGLQVDGIFGPKSRSALQKSLSSLKQQTGKKVIKKADVVAAKAKVKGAPDVKSAKMAKATKAKVAAEEEDEEIDLDDLEKFFF